jgi:hypothetical protein
LQGHWEQGGAIWDTHAQPAGGKQERRSCGTVLIQIHERYPLDFPSGKESGLTGLNKTFVKRRTYLYDWWQPFGFYCGHQFGDLFGFGSVRLGTSGLC